MSRHDEDIATGRSAAGQTPLSRTRQASFELGCPVRGGEIGNAVAAIRRRAGQWEAFAMGEQLPGSRGPRRAGPRSGGTALARPHRVTAKTGTAG
jgi:hypothetical protein